jgi:transcriptional regulator GlxA family with amidase domain
MTASPDVPFRVQIVLYEGVDPLDAIGPFEVLHAAGLMTDDAVMVELVGIDAPGPVMSGCGIVLHATAALDIATADVVLLPGAAGRTGDNAHDEAEIDPDSIPARLGRTLETTLPNSIAAALKDPNTVLTCVCGGSLIPAMAGLIEGRNAVTHHLGMALLDATGVNAIPARIVDDGDLISGGGVTSGLDVGLYLVERFLGPQVARAVEDLFEFERRGTVWRSAGLTPSAP